MGRSAERVLAAVTALDHPTADEVYEALHREGETIGRATVYRNLAHLVAAGRLRMREIGDTNRYDPHMEMHVHIHDAATGRLHDVPMTDKLRAAIDEIAAHHLREQDDCIIELRGTLK